MLCAVQNTTDVFVYRSCTDRLSGQPSLLSNGYGESACRGSKLILYLHPVRGLGISGAIPPCRHDIDSFTFCLLHEHGNNIGQEDVNLETRKRIFGWTGHTLGAGIAQSV
jgi:hypothetical protein